MPSLRAPSIACRCRRAVAPRICRHRCTFRPVTSLTNPSRPNVIAQRFAGTRATRVLADQMRIYVGPHRDDFRQDSREEPFHAVAIGNQPICPKDERRGFVGASVAGGLPVRRPRRLQSRWKSVPRGASAASSLASSARARQHVIGTLTGALYSKCSSLGTWLRKNLRCVRAIFGLPARRAAAAARARHSAHPGPLAVRTAAAGASAEACRPGSSRAPD